jgi:hypothetical protein
MWKLSGRDNKIRQWAELGEFQSISDAARRVLELECDPLGALFFRVYVDPPAAKSDAEILCRLEYQSDKGFIYSNASCSDFHLTIYPAKAEPLSFSPRPARQRQHAGDADRHQIVLIPIASAEQSDMQLQIHDHSPHQAWGVSPRKELWRGAVLMEMVGGSGVTTTLGLFSSCVPGEAGS